MIHPTNDQLDTLIYFLMYATLLGVLATVGAAIDSLFKAITARKVLRIKRLESKH